MTNKRFIAKVSAINSAIEVMDKKYIEVKDSIEDTFNYVT